MQSYPPQKHCDRCGQPDLEYPYTSYTGQIPQVTNVFFGARYGQGMWTGGGSQPFHKVGIDLGDLCQKCRWDIYVLFLKQWKEFMPRYKDFPKLVDNYSPNFTEANSDDKVKPFWEKDIVINGLDHKEIERIKIDKIRL